MNRKRQIGCFLLLAFGVLVVGGCVVSKKDYLLKVEESQNLSRELAALRSEHDRLKGDKQALDKQVIALEEQRNDLENARTQLQLKNLSLENEVALVVDDNVKLEEILRAKSDTLSKNIVDLRDHVADLKKGNKLLKEENTKLSQNIETLKVNVGSLQNHISALEKKNEALQDKANALERQRKEEILEMKGTYESLLENMESEIEKGKITITQLKGKLKVNMLDEILFDSGKISIKSQGFEVLERVGKILSDVKDRNITIEGHTDNVPIGPELRKKYPTNWELSAARATTVARYLQEKIGINPGVLSATGYGEYQPIASNDAEDGRARNRRIEIVLIPMEITPASRE
ncbi:MAG: OmpA family protein [Deltaproteobacteria bacterium]|nr:MAG: OmpA family protein [Deltaproteobacteria bacterium]